MDTLKHAGINRREALRSLAVGVGATASALWVTELLSHAEAQATHTHLAMADAGQGAAWAPAVLTGPALLTVQTLVELIIPTTDTPGAKTALVDRFIDGTLNTAPETTRTRFLDGLTWLDRRSQARFQRTFTDASPAQQADLLTQLSRDGSTEEATGVQFFAAIKAMTITGYYSTEIGLRQELGDPGELMLPAFVGCTHAEHQ